MSEVKLVAAAKNGESAALDALLRTHREQLLRILSRITRNHLDAEDAVQDSFVNVFLHIDRFDGRSTFSTWLTRIGINSALMTLRKKHQHREVPIESESGFVLEKTDSTQDPEKRLAEMERVSLLWNAVGTLRPSIRRALELRILRDCSIEEMAAEIGVSVCAAKGRLHQAKVALRKSKILHGINNRHWGRKVSSQREHLHP